LAFQDRLATEIQRWQAQGLIDAPTGQALLASSSAAAAGSGEPKPRFDVPATLALMGALLVGAAVFSFVASEWDGLSRVARMGVLLAVVWAGLMAGAWRLSRGDGVFGHALALVGMVGFGGLILTTGQLYNLDGSPQAALVWWAAGALAGALLLRSGPLAVLAALVTGAMMVMANSWTSVPGWWPVPVAVVLLAGAWRAAQGSGSRLARHAVVLAVPLLIGRICAEAGQDDIMGGLIALTGLLLYWPATRIPALTARFTGFGPELAVYGVLMGGGGLIVLQLMADPPDGAGVWLGTALSVMWAVLAVAVSVAVLLDRAGTRLGVRVAAYAVFALAVLALAFEDALGLALGRTGVLALCGVLVLLLAGLVVRMERRARTGRVEAAP
jgi:uncharacterized membrane protein